MINYWNCQIIQCQQKQMHTIDTHINFGFTNSLFEEQDNFYSSHIQEPTVIHKQDKAISPWFQKKTFFQSKKQPYKQKPPMIQFLSTLRQRQNSFRSKILKRKKLIENNNKSQILYQLSNTVIAFPKSRQNSRMQEQQETKIFQKYYKKRAKSKIIPKQIKLIQLEGSPQKIQKLAKHLSYLKKNKSPDFKDLRARKIYDVDQLSPIQKKQSQKIQYKFNRSSSMNEAQQKFYKTLNFEKMLSKTRNELIQKAKISHLNRNPQIQTLQMHCMGSTISNWNNMRTIYLNKVKK